MTIMGIWRYLSGNSQPSKGLFTNHHCQFPNFQISTWMQLKNPSKRCIMSSKMGSGKNSLVFRQQEVSPKLFVWWSNPFLLGEKCSWQLVVFAFFFRCLLVQGFQQGIFFLFGVPMCFFFAFCHPGHFPKNVSQKRCARFCSENWRNIQNVNWFVYYVNIYIYYRFCWHHTGHPNTWWGSVLIFPEKTISWGSAFLDDY